MAIKDVLTIRYNNGSYEVHDHIENADYTKAIVNGKKRGLNCYEIWNIAGKIVSDFEESILKGEKQ